MIELPSTPWREMPWGEAEAVERGAGRNGMDRACPAPCSTASPISVSNWR